MEYHWPPFAVGACLLFSFCDSLRQFYKPKITTESYLTRVATSKTVSKEFLLGYRVLVAVGSIAVLYGHAKSYGFTDLKYFTIWCYCLLTLYFILASVVTFWHYANQKDCRSNAWLESFCEGLVAMFHIMATVVWIVDLVTWTVIWPMIKHINRNDPEQLAYVTSKLFSVYSYVEHGVNIPIVLGELAINNIPLEQHMFGYVGFWGLHFALFAIGFFFKTGKWIYAVIDFTKTWSPLFYIGVHVAHHVFFMWTRYLKHQINYLLTHRRVPASAKMDPIKSN